MRNRLTSEVYIFSVTVIAFVMATYALIFAFHMLQNVSVLSVI